MVADLPGTTRLRAPMDEGNREPVDQLCQAGMILENASMTALPSVSIEDHTNLKAHVDYLGE